MIKRRYSISSIYFRYKINPFVWTSLIVKQPIIFIGKIKIHILLQFSVFNHPYIYEHSLLYRTGFSVGYMFPSTTNKQYTNFIQHPIPFRNIILFLKVHSLMYISKSLMYVTIDIVQFYTHLQTYMATCRVHNNTRGKIYMLCGRRRRHRRFPTTLHIIILSTTYLYIPPYPKKQNLFILHISYSHNAPSITLPTIIQNTIPIYYSTFSVL